MNCFDFIDEHYPDHEITLCDGFENQFIGIGMQHHKAFAVYDKNGCISQLMEEDQMTFEEAEEYFLFNVQEAYVGEQTPIFIHTCK